MSILTLDLGETMIDAIFKQAVAVSDQGGSVIAFKKQDDSSMPRLEMA